MGTEALGCEAPLKPTPASVPGKRQIHRVLWTGAAVLGVLVALLWAGTNRRALSYEGKPLKYWFNQLPMVFVPGNVRTGDIQGTIDRYTDEGGRNYGTFLEKPETTEAAIRGIGTNALPFLVKMLRRHESPLQKKIGNLAARFGFTPNLFGNQGVRRAQAVTALIVLRPLPEEYLQQIRSITTNADRSTAGAARYVLSQANKQTPWHLSSSGVSMDKSNGIPHMNFGTNIVRLQQGRWSPEK